MKDRDLKMRRLEIIQTSEFSSFFMEVYFKLILDIGSNLKEILKFKIIKKNNSIKNGMMNC